MHPALNDILRRAGRLMLDFQDPQVFSKGKHADFVTEGDLAVQTFLLEELTKAFPGARFFAEESDRNELTDALTFIIDPIDGTTNYFRRRRCSMISIGAVENKAPVFGALYDPYRNEMFHATRGRGAWCNGEPLHVSEMPFDQALIGFGTAPYYPDMNLLTSRSLLALLPSVADIRRTGSACADLCDVAAGRSDAHFEWVLQPWDYCAGTLLVEEAGGRCGNILGGCVTYDGPIPHMAASARSFDALQELLQQVHRELNG